MTSIDTDKPVLPPRRNIKLVIAYDGSNYHGWQKQADGLDTIQARVEQTASRVLGHPVVSFGAGRTDAGVHAAGQVVNFFSTNLSIPLANLRKAMDSKLPPDISVLSVQQVCQRFHASRSAIGKTYRYRIHVGPRRDVFDARHVCLYWRPLDVEAMRAGARRLIGRHDFRGFASSAEVREDTIRRIWRCDLVELEDEVHIVVEGDGFLYNMVRNIAGTLIEIGRGLWQPSRIDAVLASCDRRLAGPTAVPQGLCLMAVHYPKF